MLFLFRFLRNNLFTVVFLLLMVISILQVVRFNIYHQSFYFNTSNAVLNSTARLQDNVTSYFYLQHKNKELTEENVRLRALLSTNYLYVDTTTLIKRDSNKVARYSYTIAHVIKSTTRNQNNFITIDKGSASGVKKGDPVLSPAGIAGVVFDVSENFALVISVLNTKFAATPMIPSIQFSEGTLSWDGENPRIAQIAGVNKFEKISPGMAVVTSNYSVIFPANIPIGKIKSFKRSGNSSFFDINVELATDFHKLGQVYVVNHIYGAEIDSLAKKEVRSGH